MLCEALRPCLIDGTKWKEPKMRNRVNVIPKGPEIVKFFLIDNANNSRCHLKDDLNLDRICDLVVSYTIVSKDIKVFCLVELKGNKIDDAIDQISCVYRSLKDKCNISSQHKIKWMAFISVPGSVPIKLRKNELEERINKNCGVKSSANYIVCKIQNTNGKDELGSFIRANCS